MTPRSRLKTWSQWLVLGALIGVLVGTSSALFLWLLDHATGLRLHQDWLVWSLPLAGLALGWVYARWGGPIRGGTNLVIETIHTGGHQLPFRLGPMVLVGTILTHLFGGSGGREGTAVQIGGGLADALSHRLRLDPRLRRQMLVAGVAAGFGAVFGTPLAGTCFSVEFLGRKRLDRAALLPAAIPALVAACVGDWTTRAWGIVHTLYPPAVPLALTPMVLLKWLAFALPVAGVTWAFVRLTHGVKHQLELRLPSLPLRMAIGGAVVVALWRLVGTSDYLGLGIPVIERAFVDPALPVATFAWKLLFTAVTLGSGFLGGEVTPLFFVGATLGNSLAQGLGLPLALGAGVGLAAVFAAAAKTPVALTVMAVELLGWSVLPHAAVVCMVATWASGRVGIYGAQGKLPPPVEKRILYSSP